ncbi:MAG: hypothetical protein QM729_21520 [Solirubrobacterales bacterium]
MSNPQCPKGHDIGTYFGRYKCTAKSCGEAKNAEFGPRAVDLNELERVKQDPIRTADVMFDAKRRLSNLPANLSIEDTQKWANDQMSHMVGEAVANVKWNLRYGTAKERDAAVQRVLDYNGLTKREAVQQQQGNTIIVNMSGAAGEGAPTWLQKFVNAKVVEPPGQPKQLTAAPAEEPDWVDDEEDGTREVVGQREG